MCCENFIVYKRSDMDDLKCGFPRRIDSPVSVPVFIIAHATHRQKNMNFFLLQNESGDLLKVTLRHTDETVHGKMEYG